ncbi:MAG: FAD-binding oxidoreductase [Niabella sp.]|nr:FAD-binding oxidoreductase [Niabella sp.]
MNQQYPRKEFLKLTVLANAALLTKPLALLANNSVPEHPNVFFYKKGAAEYEVLRKGFNKRINKYPQVIALAKNTAGVAEAIQYATKNNLPVTIKSGGHCMEGFSCNNGGMVINLSEMKATSWGADGQLTVQPGCTLAELYNTILSKKRYLPGGSCGSVGIGGLTLGGGYGLLSRKYGLTCDSLLEVTMVDGKGAIVNSAADPELLWACRGGGNGNFGVITEMKFRTYPAPATMQSFRFRAFKTDPVRMRTIVEQWFLITQNLPPACFSALVLSARTAYILLTNAAAHTAEVAKVIQQFTRLTDKQTAGKRVPLAQALKVFYAEDQPIFFKNASAGLYKSFGDISGYIDKVLELTRSTPGMIYQINTLGGNIQNAEAEKDSAFPHRAYGYFSELQTYWETETQGNRLLQRFQAVQDIFAQNKISAQYRNYPDSNFKNWAHLYYGANYERLQQVKKKYDPDNRIQQEQSVQV